MKLRKLNLVRLGVLNGFLLGAITSVIVTCLALYREYGHYLDKVDLEKYIKELNPNREGKILCILVAEMYHTDWIGVLTFPLITTALVVIASWIVSHFLSKKLKSIYLRWQLIGLIFIFEWFIYIGTLNAFENYLMCYGQNNCNKSFVDAFFAPFRHEPQIPLISLLVVGLFNLFFAFVIKRAKNRLD